MAGVQCLCGYGTNFIGKQQMANEILKLGAQAVLIKGGHEDSQYAEDLFLDKNAQEQVFTAKRIDSKNTHGTGCTLSAAIAARFPPL